jgi:hypothetical protein
MWPWEHLAVGYVLVSLAARARGVRIDDATLYALAVGTQFPDLVDKPLAWTFEVLPSGTTLAHSVFFAVPLSAVVVAVARNARDGRWRRPGAAFVLGYLAHLPGDMLYGTVTTGRAPSVGVVLWPLVEKTGTGSGGFLTHVVHFLARYRQFLASGSGEAVGYLLGEVLLLSAAGILWVADGTPGVRFLRNRVRRGKPLG